MNRTIRVLICLVWFALPGYADEVSTKNDPAGSDLLADVHYRTACGPIACFVAVRFFGRTDVTLDDMAKCCKWSEGQTTTLQGLQSALGQFPEVQSQAVRTSPEKLARLLRTKEYVAILTVRRNSDQVNHAVCVFADEGGSIVGVDFPKLKHEWSLARLGDEWDGKALLISRAPEPSWLSTILQATLPGVIVGGVLMLIISSSRKRGTTSIGPVAHNPAREIAT